MVTPSLIYCTSTLYTCISAESLSLNKGTVGMLTNRSTDQSILYHTIVTALQYFIT